MENWRNSLLLTELSAKKTKKNKKKKNVQQRQNQINNFTHKIIILITVTSICTELAHTLFERQGRKVQTLIKSASFDQDSGINERVHCLYN